jgi:DNA modification methylase
MPEQAPANAPAVRLVISYLPIGEVKAYSRTLRKHSEKHVAACMGSLRAFGFLAPIVVDQNNVVVDGHALLLAAQSLGFVEVPVVRIGHLSPGLVQSCRIALNKLSEGAVWDPKALQLELTEIAPTLISHDIEVEALGFSIAEFDLMTVPDREEGREEADQLVPATVAISRPGDLWVLGDHRLLCGDALNPEDFGQLMADEKARMSFCDPPYNLKVDGVISGLGKVKHREFAMASGEMSRNEFIDFLTRYMGNCAAYSLDGSVHFACMDWRHIVELVTAGEAAFNKFLNLVVWNKTNAGMGTMYRSQHELIGVFKAGTAAHKNNFGLGETGRHRSNVWTVAGANSFGKGRDEDLAVHPTVKPTSMVMEAILDVSERGEIVLDCFCGSGTTILASEKTGRRGRAIELDPRYVDVAIRRWQTLTGQSAVLASEGSAFDQVADARTSEKERDHV